MTTDDLIGLPPATTDKPGAVGDHAEGAPRVLPALSAQSLAERVWQWLPAALSAVLVGLTCAKAIMAVDLDWDSPMYHLPFAALRVGLLTPWQFQRPPNNVLTGFYQGLPVLGDLLQGWLWRLTGRPEATNLLGIISLSALVGYLKWAFKVPAAWGFIGLFAIPAVQTAVAGAYVDVPAGAAFTVLMFSLCDLWTDPDKFRRPARWIVMFLAAFAAANMKLQTTLFVCLMMPLVLPPSWRLLRQLGASWQRWTGVGALMLGSWLAIAYNLIKNLIVYHNPVWPLGVDLGPLKLPGLSPPAEWLTVGRAYEHYPRWVQWLLSLLEFHALDGRRIPYSNGMGDVPITSFANSMGGFYGALVVASVAFFALGVWRDQTKRNRTFLLVLSYVALFVAFFPNSQNLRYDMFWMMFLVIACLIVFSGAGMAAYQQSYRIVLFSSLVFITSITGFTYFTPEWRPMQDYVDRANLDKLLEAVVRPGDVICLEQGAGPDNWDNRFTIMFAPIFHQKLNAERPYGIREAGCDGYKTISRSSWK